MRVVAFGESMYALYYKHMTTEINSFVFSQLL
jgi:hypothetical protein